MHGDYGKKFRFGFLGCKLAVEHSFAGNLLACCARQTYTRRDPLLLRTSCLQVSSTSPVCKSCLQVHWGANIFSVPTSYTKHCPIRSMDQGVHRVRQTIQPLELLGHVAAYVCPELLHFQHPEKLVSTLRTAGGPKDIRRAKKHQQQYLSQQ